MNERQKERASGFGRLLDLDQLKEYTNLGRDNAKVFARKAGSVVKIGRSVRYDREIIDKAIDKMAKGETI